MARKTVPPAVSIGEAVIWLRRAALEMNTEDAEMVRGIASCLQGMIPALEKQEQERQ